MGPWVVVFPEGKSISETPIGSDVFAGVGLFLEKNLFDPATTAFRGSGHCSPLHPTRVWGERLICSPSVTVIDKPHIVENQFPIIGDGRT
jgi:hypothetical protein